MNILYKILITSLMVTLSVGVAISGNPDRQGEAGAAELLLNPWARSAGLHTMNTATISGIEAMRLNIAGLSRLSNKELVFASTRLYQGSDVNMSALGFGNKVGTNGAFGVTISSMNFGEIPITTTDFPEGTGGSYSPSFFNIGLGYSYLYDNKISVGFLIRGVSEALPDATAFGFAVDAGVQYVTGERDNFRLGISLRNVGSPMTFSGQGLSYNALSEDGTYEITVAQKGQKFELPSMLNIGISYDFYLGGMMSIDPENEENTKKGKELILRTMANFTSNAFSRDQIGAGIELIFNDMFMVRGGYKQEVGASGSIKDNLYTGLAGGASVEIPFSQSGSSRIGLDYAYRATDPFEGTHNFSLRLIF